MADDVIRLTEVAILSSSQIYIHETVVTDVGTNLLKHPIRPWVAECLAQGPRHSSAPLFILALLEKWV